MHLTNVTAPRLSSVLLHSVPLHYRLISCHKAVHLHTVRHSASSAALYNNCLPVTSQASVVCDCFLRVLWFRKSGQTAPFLPSCKVIWVIASCAWHVSSLEVVCCASLVGDVAVSSVLVIAIWTPEKSTVTTLYCLERMIQHRDESSSVWLLFTKSSSAQL